MEKYLAVFRVRDKTSKVRYGYCWLKKRNKTKIMEVVNSRLNTKDNEVVLQIWSVDWREADYKYQLEYPSQSIIEKPETDFVPFVRGQHKFRESKESRIKLRAAVTKSVEKKTYRPPMYKVAEAPITGILNLAKAGDK